MFEKLAPNELEVLVMIAEGMSAENLCLMRRTPPRTMEIYAARIEEKCGLKLDWWLEPVLARRWWDKGFK